jgi:hypothetical protein
MFVEAHPMKAFFGEDKNVNSSQTVTVTDTK